MEQCTFAPQTYSRPGQKRTWDQIIDDQKRHEENKIMKQNMIAEEEQRAIGSQVHHPQVCKTSAKLVQDKRDGPVHD